MEKVKLYEKCFDRIGMTVFEKDFMRKGIINTFIIIDNPDGTFSVNYVVAFEYFNVLKIETVHESKLVLVHGSGL